jgi:WD40 repeat protein
MGDNKHIPASKSSRQCQNKAHVLVASFVKCTCMGLHPDGLLMALGRNDGKISVWDLKTEKLGSTLEVRSIVFVCVCAFFVYVLFIVLFHKIYHTLVCIELNPFVPIYVSINTRVYIFISLDNIYIYIFYLFLIHRDQVKLIQKQGFTK